MKLNEVNLYAKYEVWLVLSELVFKMFSDFKLWPQMTFDLTNYNRVLVLTKVDIYIKYKVWPRFAFKLSVYKHFYKVLRFLPLLSSNSLWPSPITIRFLYSVRSTYMPSTILTMFSDFDLCRCNMTFNLHQLQLGSCTHMDLHTKYEVRVSCTFAVIMFTAPTEDSIVKCFVFLHLP